MPWPSAKDCFSNSIGFFSTRQNLVQPAVITQSAYLLIAAGAFVFIVSFLGYCGAVKESRVLLGLVSFD